MEEHKDTKETKEINVKDTDKAKKKGSFFGDPIIEI